MADKVKVAVDCASYSYFTVGPVELVPGVNQTDVNGNEIISTQRHEAVQGDVIEVDAALAERDKALGFLVDPEDFVAPVNRPIPSTPFGVPQPNSEGEVVAYQGPIMGDPRPLGGLSDAELRAHRDVISPEEYEALRAKADAEGADEDEDTVYNSYMEVSKDDLKAEADSRGLEVSRGDGTEGEPLKPDYARALADDDKEDEE